MHSGLVFVSIEAFLRAHMHFLLLIDFITLDCYIHACICMYTLFHMIQISAILCIISKYDYGVFHWKCRYEMYEGCLEYLHLALANLFFIKSF